MTNFGPTKEQLWEWFNNLKTEKNINLTRHSIICQISSLVTDIAEKKIIEKEHNLTYLITSIHHQVTNFDIQHNEIKKHILQFKLKSGNNIEFYKKRLDEVKTSLLKSHYSFACFILEGKSHMKNMFDFIINQIDCLLENPTSRNLTNSNLLLIMIYNLNNIYNLGCETRVNDITLRLIKTAQDPKDIIDSIKILAKFKIIKANKLDELIILGISKSEGIETYLKEGLLNNVILLCKLDLKKYKQIRNNLILKIAESYEKDAINQSSHIAIHKLEKAREYYISLNNQEKIKEINGNIFEHTKTIDYNTIEHKTELPDIEIKGNFGFERVYYIANYPFQIPRLKNIERLTKEISEQFPLQNLFKTKYFDREKPIKEESEIPQKIIRNSIDYITIMEMGLTRCVEKLEKSNLITPQDYMDFLETFGFYDENELEIIMIGLKRHFQEDFVSSIHILIPRVELTLRKILEEKGVSVSKADRSIKNLLLRELIDKCKEFFDEDVIHYLKIKFGDPEAMNQRNIISHSLKYGIYEFNHTFSLSLIYILMRLLVLKSKN